MGATLDAGRPGALRRSARAAGLMLGRTAGWVAFLSAILGGPESPAAYGQDMAARPDFSVQRGFINAPFDLGLSSATPQAAVYYTTDGSIPSSTNGRLYTGPLRITGTAVVRAIAYAPPLAPSRVETHTYLFLDQVIRQPKSIAGWKEGWYSVGFLEPPEWPTVQWFSGWHDYEMDPAIVGNPSTGNDLRQGLLEIPTISLVMNRADFWTVNDSDRDSDVERPVSVEILYPDGRSEHADGGLIGHSHNRLKRSYRLAFREAYGDAKLASKLFRRAPLNGETATDRFDKLVLRAGNNRSWARIFNDGRVAYTRDEWYRATQLAMGGAGSRGDFAHLYVNGVYWGLYNPCERPDAHFTSEYFGGSKDDWFAWASYSIVSGDHTRFNEIWSNLIKRDLNDPVWYGRLAEYLDLVNFADYLLVTWYIGMTDWPEKNFWGGNRNTPFTTPFVHFVWDGEWSLDVTHRSNNGAWVHPSFRTDFGDTQHYLPNIWRALRGSREYMVLFADRVYRHLKAGGALSDEASRERWQILADRIRNAVLAESARWGDAMKPNGYRTRTRELDWEPEVRRVDAIFDGNGERLLDALRAQGYYPAFDPPRMNPLGGTVSWGTKVSLSSPSGALVYTVDGSDPRLPGGAVSAAAMTASGSVDIPVASSVTIKARVKLGDSWSALAEETYFGTQDFRKLVINEIHYHPLPPPGEDPETYEFIELMNAGTGALDVSGVAFTDGISFAIPLGTTMGSRSHLVLAHDAAGFERRYGFLPFGSYDGKLANEGELIVLRDPGGAMIDSVRYDDQPPWPVGADGQGPSLELLNPAVENHLADRWQASTVLGGTPGTDNSVQLAIALVEFDLVVRDGEAIDVYWVASGGQEGVDFMILRSFEQSEFEQVGVVRAGAGLHQKRYTFTLADLDPGRHAVRLLEVDAFGRAYVLAEGEAYIEPTGSYRLGPVYPNPFRNTAEFTFGLKRGGRVRIELFDALGRRVKLLADEDVEPDTTKRVWFDASDLAAGVYFIRAWGRGFSVSHSVLRKP